MDRRNALARLAATAAIVIAASACGGSTSPTEPAPQPPAPTAQTPQPAPPVPNPPAPNPPPPPTTPAPPPPTTPDPPTGESYTGDVVDVFWYEGKGGPLWNGSTVMIAIDGPVVWLGSIPLDLTYRDGQAVRAELREPGGRSIGFDLRLDSRTWTLSGSVGVANGTIR
jgi:hypothetical protein